MTWHTWNLVLSFVDLLTHFSKARLCKALAMSVIWNGEHLLLEVDAFLAIPCSISGCELHINMCTAHHFHPKEIHEQPGKRPGDLVPMPVEESKRSLRHTHSAT